MFVNKNDVDIGNATTLSTTNFSVILIADTRELFNSNWHMCIACKTFGTSEGHNWVDINYWMGIYDAKIVNITNEYLINIQFIFSRPPIYYQI